MEKRKRYLEGLENCIICGSCGKPLLRPSFIHSGEFYCPNCTNFVIKVMCEEKRIVITLKGALWSYESSSPYLCNSEKVLKQ